MSNMPAEARMLPPQIVLISDGKPTDDWKGALQALLNVPWGRRAVRQAIAIGQDADQETLRKFVDNPEKPVLRVDNAEQLVRYFRYVSTSVTATASGQRAGCGSRVLRRRPTTMRHGRAFPGKGPAVRTKK
jgi:uncharacterized protein YegL